MVAIQLAKSFIHPKVNAFHLIPNAYHILAHARFVTAFKIIFDVLKVKVLHGSSKVCFSGKGRRKALFRITLRPGPIGNG